MVEEQRLRIEKQTGNLVEDLDKLYLRKMQADMHRCALNCCENQTYSTKRVQKCVEDCGNPLNKAQQYVHGELERIQRRLQRCVMDCNDDTRDKMGSNPSQYELDKYTNEFEKCAEKCIDAFCEVIPTVKKTMIDALSNQKYN